jgi:hypothetical protein
MYEPMHGHLVTFTQTHDTTTVYHVDSVDSERVTVTTATDAANGAKDAISLSRSLFRDMGGSPVCLSDEEMAMMEVLYAAKVVEAFDLLEMIMTLSAIFGEDVGMALLPPSELKAMEKNLNEFKAGLEFLRKVRADAAYEEAAYQEAVDIARGW